MDRLEILAHAEVADGSRDLLAMQALAREVLASDAPRLAPLARTLRRDLDAAINGTATPWTTTRTRLEARKLARLATSRAPQPAPFTQTRAARPAAHPSDERNELLHVGAALTALGRGSFDSSLAADRVAEVFGVASLDAFGTFERAELSAMGALVDYLKITQKGKLPLLRPPQKEASGGGMQIDAATRRNLELTAALSGGRAGSLLACIDRTVTAGGARLLERRLSSPSRDLAEINARLEAVGFSLDETEFRSALREALRKVPDIDRALSRLSLDRGGPRDLTAVRNALEQAAEIGARHDDTALPARLHDAVARLSGHDALLDLLDQALVAEPPLLARDGGFIAPGHDSALDEARLLRDALRLPPHPREQEALARMGFDSRYAGGEALALSGALRRVVT